jgi:hypothetical protein
MRKPTFTVSSAGPPNDQFLASKIGAYHISIVQIAYRLGQEAFWERLLSTDNIPDDLQHSVGVLASATWSCKVDV